jgi:hypothetical protein
MCDSSSGCTSALAINLDSTPPINGNATTDETRLRSKVRRSIDVLHLFDRDIILTSIKGLPNWFSRDAQHVDLDSHSPATSTIN